MTTLGDTSIFSISSTGFLCSRQYASKAILPCLDWAVSVANDADACIMSTFHSPLEADVLKFLLRGKCMIILVLARSLYKKIPPEYQQAIDEGRMLIISVSDQTRISKDSANKANEFILDHSQNIVFGFISEGSHLNDIKVQAMERGLGYSNISTI